MSSGRIKKGLTSISGAKATRRRGRHGHFFASRLQIAVAMPVALLLALGFLSWPVAAAPAALAASAGRIKQVLIGQVGRATTFRSAGAPSAVTRAPGGLASGDVVVSYLETPANSSVECSAPSSAILDVLHGSTRLVACLTVIGKAVPTTIKAAVTPRNQVTMVTLAFSGVNLRKPVDRVAGSASGASPAVVTSVANDEVVYGEGSSGRRAAAHPVSGARLAATINDAATSQVAAATHVVRAFGSTAPVQWRVNPASGQPAAAAVALRVAPSAPPAAPPVTWCETGLPASPYTSAPKGAVRVRAGDNSGIFQYALPRNKTYWFAPGKHTGASVQASNGDTFIGAPGAILDGGNNIQYAFTGKYNYTGDQHVTVKYLTIQNFKPNQGGGAVNGNGNNGWTEAWDLMQLNSPGAAMMLGGDNTVTDNCLTRNGEYGFNGYSYVDQTYEHTFTGGATNIVFTNNDVSLNNTQKTSTGVEGGGKFWQDGNVTVANNYFHANIDSPGVWMDTDNAGFLVENNYFSNNGTQGLMYEISYNADIIGNTFADNAIEAGPGNPGFPTGAIYVSESGGDKAVASYYPGVLNIQNNSFTDNWSGVVLFQNSNRYVGDGQDPGTLTPPHGVGIQAWINTVGPNNCPSHLTETSPVDYHSICQWRTQHVIVQGNKFAFNPGDPVYGGKCTRANNCGQNGLFSPYSSTAAYPTYSVCNAISNRQGNVFAHNAYTGPWSFMYFNQGDVTNWAQWKSGLRNVEASGDNFGRQDAGSTIKP